MKDKNIVGDFYVAPHPFFFDEEYKKKSWEKYKLREKQGFPCDDYKAEKHGHWEFIEQRKSIYDLEGIKTWGTVYRCSECGKMFTFGEDHVSFAWCPNCGAIMDEVNE